MNWTIIIIETIVLTLAFTAMILIPLVKNPVWWIADYPEDIQEEYWRRLSRLDGHRSRRGCAVGYLCLSRTSHFLAGVFPQHVDSFYCRA